MRSGRRILIMYSPTAAKLRPIVMSGITGHVGRELARQLLSAGFDVHGLTRQELAKLAYENEAITLHRIDGRTETLVRLFQEIRPEVAIHLAGLARRSHLISDLVPFFEANILYGSQILEASTLSGCTRFITAESILQYAESGEAYPMNLYAATKHAFADVLQYYVDAFDLSAIALVLPTLYSERERNSKLMTDTALALQEETVLEIQATDVLIDFVHVEDVADAFVIAASLVHAQSAKSAPTFKRYCITSGKYVTPRDLVALFEQVGKKRITVHNVQGLGNSRRRKPWHGLVLPGWSPKIDLETGIRRMLSVKR